MKLQKLYSKVRQAIEYYDMISEGDKIAVGISGGKDSLTLLYALAGLREFYPKRFELVAITVSLGYENFDLSPVRKLCRELDVEYHVLDTEIYKLLEDKAKEQASPCSWCAKFRKGALNNLAKELGCNKVAYAHHADDVIETMLLSLIFEGRFYSFPPVTYMEDIELTIIRPLMYVYENEVIGFKKLYSLPVVSNPCAYDGHTKRQYVKELLKSINSDNPGAKKRMYTAILKGNIPDWTGLAALTKE